MSCFLTQPGPLHRSAGHHLPGWPKAHPRADSCSPSPHLQRASSRGGLSSCLRGCLTDRGAGSPKGGEKSEGAMLRRNSEGQSRHGQLRGAISCCSVPVPVSDGAGLSPLGLRGAPCSSPQRDSAVPGDGVNKELLPQLHVEGAGEGRLASTGHRQGFPLTVRPARSQGLSTLPTHCGGPVA